MTIFQLECFLALSRSLNFRQTSEDLFISQPTLSRSIASLEKEIEVQLLERNTKTVELTAAGKLFAAETADLLQQFHNSIDNAKLARDGHRGELKLGIPQDAFEPYAVDLINFFRREHPEIDLQLCPLSNSNLQKELNSGRLDLIIGSGKNSLRNPGTLLLSERPECAVLPPTHPLAERTSVRMEELKDEKFISMSPVTSASGHYLLLKYANDAGFSPNIVTTAKSIASMMMLIASGVGVGILYQDLAINAHHRLCFIPLEEVENFRRYLVWDEESRNPALNAFLRCAEDLFPAENA